MPAILSPLEAIWKVFPKSREGIYLYAGVVRNKSDAAGTGGSLCIVAKVEMMREMMFLHKRQQNLLKCE
jgi:hypothetical protein